MAGMLYQIRLQEVIVKVMFIQVTQQNTASAEEGAAAAEELSSQAAHLKGLMATFKVKGVIAKASASQPALPQPPPVASGQKAGGPAWDEVTPAAGPNPSEVIDLDDKEFGKY